MPLAVSWRSFSTYNIIAAVLDQRPVVDDHGNGAVVPRFLFWKNTLHGINKFFSAYIGVVGDGKMIVSGIAVFSPPFRFGVVNIVKIPAAGDKYHIFFRELYCFDSIEQFHS